MANKIPFNPVVLNVRWLATHKTDENTIWRSIYYYNTTTTQVLATLKQVPSTQKWVATHLLRNTVLT